MPWHLAQWITVGIAHPEVSKYSGGTLGLTIQCCSRLHACSGKKMQYLARDAGEGVELCELLSP